MRDDGDDDIGEVQFATLVEGTLEAPLKERVTNGLTALITILLFFIILSPLIWVMLRCLSWASTGWVR